MFSKNVIHILALSFIITTIASCTHQQMDDIHPLLKQLPQASADVIDAQNDFAFDIFNLISENAQDHKNKLISPLSIYMDLSMVYNGANNQTKEDMQKALRLSNIDTSLLNKTNAALLNNLPNIDPSVNLDIANAIWYRQTLNPISSFLKINKKYYNAKIQGASFDPSTVSDINHWVSDKTHQKINKIIDEIRPQDVMFLLNAVYFKGAWSQTFDAKLTDNHTFYTKGSGNVQTPFMYKEHRYEYLENDTLQMVRLPYGKGHFNMVILLPKDNENRKNLIRSLNAQTYSTLISQMHPTQLKLYLPKWEYSYKTTLNDVLSTMGMGVTFTRNADFSNMYQNKTVKISEVKHKTYIKVDEKGTEAAAVTSTGMQATAVGIGIPTMKINHPFVYLITEKDTNSILFLGVVNNPK